MKLRHPTLIKAAGFAGAWAIRLWMATLRFRYRPLGSDLPPTRYDGPERFIYAFWHENILLTAYLYGPSGAHVLISQHADGEFTAEACRRLGLNAVRGSTTRGGAEALREMIRLSEYAHLVITPDGPRGPRRQVQTGLVYLAARTGRSIVPSGFACDRPWRARSWDRFVLPRPWSRAAGVIGEPIRVPANAGRRELEQYRRAVEAALARVQEEAERRAAVPGVAQRTPGDGGVSCPCIAKGWSLSCPLI